MRWLEREHVSLAEYRLRGTARRAVQSAVGAGTLTRPETCSQCGRRPPLGVKVEAHHEDYTRPLDVVWLCGSCHKRLHLEEVASVGA